MEEGEGFHVPDGIIAYLSRQCSGNVHERRIVDVEYGSFAKETHAVNPHPGLYENGDHLAAKNAADLTPVSYSRSAFRSRTEDIPHGRNNWLCYDFKGRRIVLTHYTIRMHNNLLYSHLKSWVIETSVDGVNWWEVDHQEDNKQLNGSFRAGTFGVAAGSAASLGW
jgi:hypothetical protein